MTDQRKQDQQAILASIHSIFEAFSKHDKATLVRTHLPDFCGFTVRSRATIPQRDQYLAEIETQLKEGAFQDHELSDVVFTFRADTAVVCYIARLRYLAPQGQELHIKLRILDVYVKTQEGWNLLASNANLHPDEIDQRLSSAVGNRKRLQEAGLL